MPETLQYFFEDVLTVMTTFDVDDSVMSRDTRMLFALIVLFTFTVGSAFAATVVVVDGDVVVVTPSVVLPDDVSTVEAAARVTTMV